MSGDKKINGDNIKMNKKLPCTSGFYSSGLGRNPLTASSGGSTVIIP
jgi:hypothetical protein